MADARGTPDVAALIAAYEIRACDGLRDFDELRDAGDALCEALVWVEAARQQAEEWLLSARTRAEHWREQARPATCLNADIWRKDNLFPWEAS